MSNKTILIVGGAVAILIALIIIINLGGESIKLFQTSSEQVDQEYQCTKQGCTYNLSESTTHPCRNATGENTATCSTGQHNIPLEGLFGNTGIVVMLPIAGLLLLIIGIILYKKHN